MSTDTANHVSDEAQTTKFLKTNGPPEFKPNIPANLLKNMSEDVRWLYEQVGISTQQNQWIITQVVGLKGAHRQIHAKLDQGDERFKKIDETLDVFTKLREAWLTRRKMVRNILIGCLTLVILPFLGLFLVEACKHWLGWQ